MWLYSDEQHFNASVSENHLYSEDPDYRLACPLMMKISQSGGNNDIHNKAEDRCVRSSP